MAEEVEQEVEAMEAVYGPDCTVFRFLPPHLSVSLKPRTADDLSVQFVEAVLVIKAGDQYPDVPPRLELKDAKGLGDKRHAKLLADLNAQAIEFSGEPMLVAICEAATDLLTNINIPEGDCCFCMNPLVTDDHAQPFMKLMSCFHCFHSDCFGDWWRWLHNHRLQRPSHDSAVYPEEGGGERSAQHFGGSSEQRSLEASQDFAVHCPVCRTIINPEDVAHVWHYLNAESNFKPIQEEDTNVPCGILTKAELDRRAQFSALFEAQQARGAIIEVKKLEVILPGMIAPRLPQLEERNPTGEDPEEGIVSTNANNDNSSASNLPSREADSRAHPFVGHVVSEGRTMGRGSFGRRPNRGRRGRGFGVSRGFQRGSNEIRRDVGTRGSSRIQ